MGLHPPGGDLFAGYKKVPSGNIYYVANSYGMGALNVAIRLIWLRKA